MKQENQTDGLRSFDIDLVYLWVDGSDPEWLARRASLRGDTAVDASKDGEGRYAERGELIYSLRSVAEYAPWIRRIFIVTDRQIPRGIDTNHPKIRIVDHTEILPPEALPTFNSTVIEHALFRIPGLAEKFLYANDDMFFNRPVQPDDFFTPQGLPIARMNRRPLRGLSLWFKEKIQRKQLSTYNRTIQTSAKLVDEKFGRYIGHKTHHNIDAYDRSDYQRAFELFREPIEATFHHRFRSDDDVQRNLYTYVAMAERRAKVCFVGRKTSFRLHIDNPAHYGKLEKATPMLFCLNDSEYSTEADRRRMVEFLEKRFPNPSPFEK